MHRADESAGQRELIEQAEPGVHRSHAVHDLGDVRRQGCTGRVDLEGEHVVEARLGPFDLGAEHSFASDVHRHEQLEVRQAARQAVETPEGEVGS
jgi:hypothetical protein